MLSWVSVDARTGELLAELPDLTPQGPCAVTIGRYESLGFELPYPPSVINGDAGAVADLADWNAASRPGAAVLVALDESDSPIWGGLVLTRTKSAGPSATLNTATMEAYLDRRYTGPYNAIGSNQSTIVSDLIDQFIADDTLPGLPIRVASTASASTRSVSYNDYDDKTVYVALGGLSGLVGGPQWTISWEWQTAPQRITPVFTVADRLGSPIPAALVAPAALFSMPGCVTDFQFVEDWSSGKGANRVTATGQGQGLTRPVDHENTADFSDRPTFEYRYSPASSGSSTVQQHALAALAALQNGTNVLTLTAAIQDAPILGVDWNLGDDVGYDLDAPGFRDGSLRDGVGLCIGWRRDNRTVSPVLFTQDATQL